MEMTTIKTLCTVIVSLFTILSLLYKFVVKPIIRIGNDILQTIETSKKQIQFIESELKPNHGNSIKDVIRKLADQQSINSKNLEEVRTSIARVNDMAIVADNKSTLHLKKSPIAMFECNATTGDCIWTNDALQEMFGIGESQMLGQGWLSALHPDDIPQTYHVWQNTIKNWIPYRVRYRIVVNNIIKTVEVNAEIVKNNKGVPLTIIGSAEIIK